MNVLMFHFLAIIIPGTFFLVHVISCTKLATTSHDTEVPLTLELVTNSNLGTSQRQLLQLVPLTASLSNIS